MAVAWPWGSRYARDRFIVTGHTRFAASVAATVAVVLTLGLWVPGARSLGRERPVRRPARTGWSARSAGSALWVVPDQECAVATPGAGAGSDAAGSRVDAPPGVLVTPADQAPTQHSRLLVIPEPVAQLSPLSRAPSRGRAPPALLA